MVAAECGPLEIGCIVCTRDRLPGIIYRMLLLVFIEVSLASIPDHEYFRFCQRYLRYRYFSFLHGRRLFSNGQHWLLANERRFLGYRSAFFGCTRQKGAFCCRDWNCFRCFLRYGERRIIYGGYRFCFCCRFYFRCFLRYGGRWLHYGGCRFIYGGRRIGNGLLRVVLFRYMALLHHVELPP